MIHDTEKLLRLEDSDRGKNEDVLSARVDRKSPGSQVVPLNYKLKDAVLQLLNLRLIEYDDSTPMDVMPLRDHARYLTSDLLGTKAFYDYLMARLTPGQQAYHARFIAPLTPVLVAMGETGVRLNSEFVLTESHKLEGMLAAISEAHKRRHGHPLMGMNAAAKVSWLFGELGLVPDQFTKPTPAQLRRGDKRGDPSLSADHLRVLAKTYAGHSRAVSSLTLVRRFQQVEYLLSGLEAVAKYVDHRDGRVHTTLRDTLATGRISSSSPNLQGIAKRQVIAGVPVRCRNILIASEGFELVAFDIAQADIRVMENAVASFPCSSYEHLRKLREERLVQLGPHIGLHLAQLKAHRNPTYKFLGGTSEPGFFPSLPCALAGILRKESGDLYTEVARQVTGQKQVGKQERNIFKTVTLSIANSITPTGLARRLGYSDDLEGRAKAKGHMEDFWRAYPQVASFTELMRWQVALTGQTETWAGRTRICTAHHWMTTLSRVEILISFKGPEWLWLDVIPLRPGRNGLTVWIRKVWDATFRSSNLGRLIYEDVRGPLCTGHTGFFKPILH